MVADVLRQAAHIPLLGWGSLVVSFVEHILGLEGETEEAVEPSPAPSRTGFYDSTPLSHGWVHLFSKSHHLSVCGGVLYGCGFCLGRHWDVGWSPPHTSHLIGFGGVLLVVA